MLATRGVFAALEEPIASRFTKPPMDQPCRVYRGASRWGRCVSNSLLPLLTPAVNRAETKRGPGWRDPPPRAPGPTTPRSRGLWLPRRCCANHLGF